MFHYIHFPQPFFQQPIHKLKKQQHMKTKTTVITISPGKILLLLPVAGLIAASFYFGTGYAIAGGLALLQLATVWYIIDLKNKYKKMGLPESKADLLVLAIERSESISDSLGISDKRNSEIVECVHKAFKETDKLTEGAEIMSREAKHPNELWYMGFLANHIKTSSEMQAHKMMMLGKLFGGMEDKENH